MRRKVLQDFANTVCQSYVDLHSGSDVAAFACYGSGTAIINFLSGDCTFNDNPVPALKGGTYLKEWLHERFEAHSVVVNDIALAQMRVAVVVSNVQFKRSYGYLYCSGRYKFHCQSEVQTDEKTYIGQMYGEKLWGFQEKYYVALCGQPEEEIDNG